MFRIVRTADLAALREQAAKVDGLTADAVRLGMEATTATNSANRAEAVAGQQLRQLAQANADLVQAERDRDAARAELAEARKDAIEGYGEEVAGMRADLDRMLADAAHPETGDGFKAALAYRLLRGLYQQAKEQTTEQGGEIVRLFAVSAHVLGFDEPETPPVPVSQPGDPRWKTCVVCESAKPAEGFSLDVCPECMALARRPQVG